MCGLLRLEDDSTLKHMRKSRRSKKGNRNKGMLDWVRVRRAALTREQWEAINQARTHKQLNNPPPRCLIVVSKEGSSPSHQARLCVRRSVLL